METTMEIHFYEAINVCPPDRKILHDWESATIAINNKINEIHTTQMCILGSTLLGNGYKVFVHQGNGITYEITVWSKDNVGNRAVRYSQNLYNLWKSNVFRE